MSAIGQYVHLYAKNYAEKGTNKLNQGTSESAAAALSRERESIRKRIGSLKTKTDTDNENLEKRINNLIDLLGGNKEFKTDKQNQLSQEAQQAVIDMLNLESEKFMVDLANMNVTATSGSGGIGQIKDPQHYSQQNRNYEKNLTDRIKKLNEVIQSTEKDINKLSKQNDVPDLILKIDMVKKLAEETQDSILNAIHDCTDGRTGLVLKKDKDVINVINELIAAYAPALGLAALKGKLFENVLSLVPTHVESLIQNEMDDIASELEKAVAKNNLATNKSSVRMGRQFFSKGMLAKSKGNILHESTVQFGDIVRTVRESQQKIDVKFQYNGRMWNISAKNIKISPAWGAKSKLITVTSGNSLLQMIQDEDSSFVNHYLNLFANHTDSGYENSFAGNRQGYVDTLKMMVLYKAITGDTYGRRTNDLATTFIVNNNSYKGSSKSLAGHVKVVNVKQILDNILGTAEDQFNGDRINVKTQGIANVLVANHRYNNDMVEAKDNAWARTGTARIANILNQVHAAKVHASINVGALFEAQY